MKPAQEYAKEALENWRNDADTKISQDGVLVIASEAATKARAAGFAEAIEKATALFSAFVVEAEGRKSDYPDVIPIEINTAKWFARRISELTPAATTKEPK